MKNLSVCLTNINDKDLEEIRSSLERLRKLGKIENFDLENSYLLVTKMESNKAIYLFFSEGKVIKSFNQTTLDNLIENYRVN